MSLSTWLGHSENDAMELVDLSWQTYESRMKWQYREFVEVASYNFPVKKDSESE